MLKGNRSLKTLRLNCCSIGDEAIVSLTKGLVGHPALQKLDLGNCMAEEHSIKFLGDTLSQDNVLKSLNLSENFKVPESAFMYMVKKMIESNKLMVEKFNLTGNGNLKKPAG